MKALAEQQAENGVLKEARMHAAANSEQQARQKLQQLEQQLQQMAREQEVGDLPAPASRFLHA